VAIADQVGQYFAVNPLDHTRVILASFDAEEAGLRGARAYAQKNRQDLTQMPTFDFNLDCPYQVNEIFFMTTDINGFVKLSASMAQECQQIAERLGYQATTKPVQFLLGGTDAAELAKIGVEATNLMAMPWGNSDRAAAYHTMKDTIDAVEPAAVQASIEIAIEYVKQKEQQLFSGSE
jgi:Zn-dependent M28 family amino/carboxypeptidase